MHVAGFVLFALIGRYMLKRLGKAYQQKQCSDRSITMDSMWIMFAVVQSIGFAFEGVQWILTAPVACRSRLWLAGGTRRTFQRIV